MKRIYPIVLKPEGEGGYVISVPDLSIDTQGDTLAEAIDMARDAISLTCIDLEDDHKPTPAPSAPESIALHGDELLALADVDTDAYRARMNNRAVRKNVSIPEWMAMQAEARGISLSQTLQDALRAQLA